MVTYHQIVWNNDNFKGLFKSDAVKEVCEKAAAERAKTVEKKLASHLHGQSYKKPLCRSYAVKATYTYLGIIKPNKPVGAKIANKYGMR